jgi:glycosyltransferase involved in cell wall biosynthesis
MTASSSLVDVIIPAFNEAENLHSLLSDVGSSSTHEFTLRSIMVVSDASTDRTDELIQGMAELDHRIHLIRNDTRVGKNGCLDNVLRSNAADVVVIMDGDIRLADEHTLSYMVMPIISCGYDLVGCNIIPVRTRIFSPAQMARTFDWLIENHCRRVKQQSYYSCYGRAMAITGNCLLTAVREIPPNQADDLYIYFSVRAKGLRFHYSEHAVVLFSAATSMRDYARQYIRYWHYKANAATTFGKPVIDSDLSIPSVRRFVAQIAIAHPILAFAWVVTRFVTAWYQRLPVPQEYNSGLYYTDSAPVSRGRVSLDGKGSSRRC